MKRILITLTLFFSMLAAAFAQAPQKFTYQAVVRNESNTLVRGNVGVRISILQGGANGTMVYQETHTAVTNANGLMTLQIGGGIVMNGDFATIDWADGPYFLKTETDPTGGTNYTIEGTQQLLSVPYALYAGHAANSFSGSYNDLTDQPDIPTVPTNVSAFTNDAGYITMDSVPAIPTNVSYFTNDAGYVTESTLTTENYITQNDLITNNYVTEADIPTNVSAFTNDAGYITMDSIPAIPTVPTNVSAFVNDAGYVTESTLTTNNYITQNDLVTNNYVTEADIPTNVSAFNNDAGYLTSSDCGNMDFCSLVTALAELQSQVEALQYAVDSLSEQDGGTGSSTAGQYVQPCPGTSTLTDRDGNTYNTVQIGVQCWMKENLRTTKYADGTSIAQGSDTSSTTAYWYYPNGDASNKTTYGLLYNRKAWMRNSSSSSANPSGVQGICPMGWHVPSNAEWTQLTDYVSSQSQYLCGSDSTYIAKALADTTGWQSDTLACAVGNILSDNNATGFSALPAGSYAHFYNPYTYFGKYSYFGSTDQWGRHLRYNGVDVNRSGTIVNGNSVRCVKD